MSRYRVRPRTGTPPGRVVTVGWDPPANSYFADVEDQPRRSGEEPRAVLSVGNTINEIRTIEELQRLLEPYASLDPEMAEQLRRDAEAQRLTAEELERRADMAKAAAAAARAEAHHAEADIEHALGAEDYTAAHRAERHQERELSEAATADHEAHTDEAQAAAARARSAGAPPPRAKASRTGRPATGRATRAQPPRGAPGHRRGT